MPPPPPCVPLLAAVAALLGVLGAASLLAWQRRQRRRLRWEPAGTLSAIHVYPLKSGAPLQCRQARVTEHGLRSGATLDRCLALVCDGRIVCIMARCRMVLIAAHLTDDDVTLTAPGMAPLTVPLPNSGDGSGGGDSSGGGDGGGDGGSDGGDGGSGGGGDGGGGGGDGGGGGGDGGGGDGGDDGGGEGGGAKMVSGELFGYLSDGLDLGQAATRWLGEFFADGKTYTLMFFRAGAVPARRTVDIPRAFARLAADGDVSAFQNVTALSVICEASLDALNARLDTPVTLDNFRQNLVVAGAPAFDDDDWAFVRVGGAVMRRVKAVNRCANTCVDPRTGERSAAMEPLRTLKTFRLAQSREERLMYKESPLMGVALGVDVEGDVAVGDTVWVRRR